MAISVEELKVIASELTEGWDGEPPEIYVTAASAIHELVAIKETKPVAGVTIDGRLYRLQSDRIPVQAKLIIKPE